MAFRFYDPPSSLLRFYLIRQDKAADLQKDFERIVGYLSTFVGEIGVERLGKNSAVISYADTPLKATLKADGVLKEKGTIISQITLTCEQGDNLSLDLLRSFVSTLGYRIFNPQNHSFMAANYNLMDLTTVGVSPKAAEIFRKYCLVPLFRFRDAPVFFARGPGGEMHLVNRHLFEHLSKEEGPSKIKRQGDFSVVIAPDIIRFTALLDQDLIPTPFYGHLGRPSKIINLSGFNPDSLERQVLVDSAFFGLDVARQSFQSLGLYRRDVLEEGDSLADYIQNVLKISGSQKYFMAAKLENRVSFINGREGKLNPWLKLGIFLDKTN